MAQKQPNNWRLQSFINSLVSELDKARDTLAYKGMQQPLSYDVKNLSLDLQLFPEFDGREVRFNNAKAGDTGASRISIELGSISDRQIRETTRPPVTKDELPLDEVEDIEPEIKETLEKVGVRSVKDLEQLESRNVDVEKVVRRQSEASGSRSYGNLADRLKKLRGDFAYQQDLSTQMEARRQNAPSVQKVNVTPRGDDAIIRLEGQNLALRPDFTPAAKVNGTPREVLRADASYLEIQCPAAEVVPEGVPLEIILDPHAVLRFTLKWPGKEKIK